MTISPSSIAGWLRRLCRTPMDLWRAQDGATAIFMAFGIVPMVAALGMATDTGRGYLLKARLSQALDAAALAGGRIMASTNRDADINMFFKANFPTGYLGSTLTGPVITAGTNGTLTLSATATLPTTFMQVLGFKTMTVGALAEVTQAISALDFVLSMDVSGSMNSPSSKIQGARDAAHDLLGVVYGTATSSPTLSIDGTTYNLINAGLVPWSHMVKATYNGVAYNAALTTKVTLPFTFTNPITGVAQNFYWHVNNSPVKLLRSPQARGELTWSGYVYSRYIGDGDQTNDADLSLGEDVTVGGKRWYGWDPTTDYEGQPRTGDWTSTESTNGWSGVARQCLEVFWNATNMSATTGTYSSTTPKGYPRPIVPVAPAGYPVLPTEGGWSSGDECFAGPTNGLTALTPSRSTVDTAINQLVANGGTDIPAGLAMAWEVLMPGEPFNQGYTTTPFPRARAIVLMTDGQIEGWWGDSYRMKFGSSTAAGTQTGSGNMPFPPAPTATTKNNLNNRLIQLAMNIKAQGIKIYVVKFDINNATVAALLQAVASGPGAPYYYTADDASDLRAAFVAIGGSLSKLRLSK